MSKTRKHTIIFNEEVEGILNDVLEDDYSDFETSGYVGVRVYHETFGYGRILETDGNYCKVLFEDAGVKKVMGNYLRRA